jgi:DHA3 family macrolide efflux protein-like MFS transporter
MLSAYRHSLIGTNSAFRNLFLGQAISQVGDALYYVSFMFMVEKLTGNLAMVGYVGAAEVLPFLLFGPYAGVLADRIDRRKILLWADIGSAMVLFCLAIFALIRFPIPGEALIITGFLTASVRTFFFPAKNAAIPRLVAPKDLQNAFAISMGTQNLMFMAGTAFAATVMSAMYENMTQQGFLLSLLGFNCLSFLGSAVFIAKLPAIKPEQKTVPQRASTEFVGGLRFIVKRKDLMTLMGVGMLFGLCVAPFFVMYVAANKQWFGGGPATLAWCEFAFFLGMIIGSYAVGRKSPKRVGISFITGAALVGIFVLLMAFSPNFYLFCWWNVACGLVVPFIDIPRQTYMQATVPDAFRGRVNSVATMTNFAVMPLGMAGAGQMLQKFGLVTMFIIMGAGMTAASLLGLLGKDFREAKLPEGGVEPSDSEQVYDGAMDERALAS